MQPVDVTAVPAEVVEDVLRDPSGFLAAAAEAAPGWASRAASEAFEAPGAMCWYDGWRPVWPSSTLVRGARLERSVCSDSDEPGFGTSCAGWRRSVLDDLEDEEDEEAVARRVLRVCNSVWRSLPRAGRMCRATSRLERDRGQSREIAGESAWIGSRRSSHRPIK